MNLNWLTNPDFNLQEKMRYFSDNFLFTNEYLGRLPNLTFDNPISLVNKIIFQLENNIERAPRYIENHYRQLNLHFGAFLKKHYPEFLPVEQEYSKYSQCPTKEKKRIAWLKAHAAFLTYLRHLEEVLKKDLFQKIFAWLTKYLQCPHKLNTHKKDIEFCTQILISLYRLAGHSKKQVAGYINRILSKDRYSFPFPLTIYAQNKDESFNSITEEYLKNSDFQKQFEGLKNLMVNHEQRAGYFIYAIDHVVIDKNIQSDFYFQIDKVTFISPAHALFKKLRASVKKVDRENPLKMYPLFFSKNKLLAHVKLSFEDKDFTRHLAAKIIKEELTLLNQYLDCKMELTDGNFLFIENLGSDHWSGKRKIKKVELEHIYGIKLDWLKNSPFEILRNHNFSGKEHFLHNEKTFIKAMQEESASSFWQYIENLYWFQNSEKDDIRRKFVTLLMKKRARFTDQFLIYIGHLFFGLHKSKFSTEISDSDKVIEKISSELGYQRNVKFPIGKYKSNIKHPFLRSVITLYMEVKSKNHAKRWEEHFSALLLELQEYRNTELHSGYANKYSEIKLNNLIPEIMNKARWAVVEACAKNKKHSFNVIMEKLSS